jgi:hypothetical protein
MGRVAGRFSLKRRVRRSLPYSPVLNMTIQRYLLTSKDERPGIIPKRDNSALMVLKFLMLTQQGRGRTNSIHVPYELAEMPATGTLARQ